MIKRYWKCKVNPLVFHEVPAEHFCFRNLFWIPYCGVPMVLCPISCFIRKIFRLKKFEFVYNAFYIMNIVPNYKKLTLCNLIALWLAHDIYQYLYSYVRNPIKYCTCIPINSISMYIALSIVCLSLNIFISNEKVSVLQFFYFFFFFWKPLYYIFKI